MPTTPVTTMLYTMPWAVAVWANQHRYPTNPRVPLLRSSEIISDDLFLTQADLEILDKNAVVEPYKGKRAPAAMDRLFDFRNSTENDGIFPPEIYPPDDTIACARIPHKVAATVVVANDDDDGNTWIPPCGVRRVVRRCRIELPAAAKVLMSECVVRHESWIHARDRQLTIITFNETWAKTGRFGDITAYKALSPIELQGSIDKGIPVVVPGDDSPVLTTSKGVDPKTEGCLFRQYAYFQVSPSLKIPFRSRIEQSLLDTYQKNTSQGRKLDLEFMDLRERKSSNNGHNNKE